MKKIKSLFVAMLIMAGAMSIVEMGKALDQPFPVYGYIKDSTGSPLAGVAVYIKDLTKSTQLIVYTQSNGYYQADLFNLQNCENGDTIEVYCEYGDENNSKIFVLDVTELSKNVSFSLIAPPTVSTLNASSITSSSAKLNGELINLGGDSSCQVWFEYGETTSYGYSTGKQTKYSATTFSATITGLEPDTTYHFRVVAKNSRKISYGVDKTFHTPPALPQVTTQAASNIGYSFATLNGYLSKVGAASCQVWFVYDVVSHTNWEDYAYSTPHLTKTSPSSFSYELMDLEIGITYHFRAVASNAAGTVAGDDVTFTTQVILPSIITLDASNITSNTAILKANLTDLGGANSCQVWFEYGETTSYGYSTEIQNVSESGEISVEISGLTPGTTYHFRAVAENSKGRTYGYDRTFETTAVKATTETRGMEYAVVLKANLTDMGGDEECYVYFEYWEEGGEKQQTPKKIMNSTGEFSEVITGLKENATYFYRAVVENSQGISYGVNLSFKTIALPSPPVVKTLDAIAFQHNATLYANVSDMGESIFCYLWFEYWDGERKTTGVMIVNSTGIYDMEIGNLVDGKKYYYRAIAVGSNGRIFYGEVKNFTTLAGENHEPSIIIIAPENNSIVDVKTSLMVNVYDADGDTIDVTFYWENGSKIYEVETLNGVTSIAVNLEYGKEYAWYALANDGMETNSTPIQFFRTFEKVVANFTHSFAFVNETVYFNDSSQGNITQWIWNFGDGEMAYGKKVNHTYIHAGKYKVNLTVVDLYGNKYYAEKEIEVWERGDANMDSKINAVDIAIIKRIIEKEEDAEDYPPADVNGDGNVNEKDLHMVVNKILGLA